jgi:hypothetical protein
VGNFHCRPNTKFRRNPFSNFGDVTWRRKDSSYDILILPSFKYTLWKDCLKVPLLLGCMRLYPKVYGLSR